MEQGEKSTGNDVASIEFSMLHGEDRRHGQRHSVFDCLLRRLLLRHVRNYMGNHTVPVYRPLLYRSETFETESVESFHVEKSEPKMFKSMNYEDFNDYLRRHCIVTDAEPITSRLKLQQGESGVASAAASRKQPHANLAGVSSPPLTPKSGAVSQGFEIVPAEGLEKVTILEISLQLVGQVQNGANFMRPEHFMVTVAEETDALLKRMLGRRRQGSKQWEAFKASEEANNELKFILDVYLDAFQYFPRHCYKKCNNEWDALQCCWEEKFGYTVSQSDNRLRLATLIHMLRCDLTRAICIFLHKKGLRIVDYPDYVHMIMECTMKVPGKASKQQATASIPAEQGTFEVYFPDKHTLSERQWMASAFDDRIAGLPSTDSYRRSGNYSLAEKTGLPLSQVKIYKDRYKSAKYSFETKQDEKRIWEFHGCEKTSGMTKYAVILPCVRRYPKKLFKDLPKAVQKIIVRRVRMFSSIDDKRLHIWYNRIRRTETQLMERRRRDAPLYLSIGTSKF